MIFYEFANGHKYKNAWWADGMGFEGSITCPKHTRPGNRKNPLTIKLESPRISDIIWTWYSECIVTERAAEFFSQAGFTGYRLEPVIVTEVKDGNVSELPKMWEFVVTGKGGSVEQINKIRVRDSCEDCGMVEYTSFGKGLNVDENQWDGSDFFTVWPLPKFIIVTERVKDFVTKNKISNVKLMKTQDLKGEGEKGRLGPGSYEKWLNDIR